MLFQILVTCGFHKSQHHVHVVFEKKTHCICLLVLMQNHMVCSWLIKFLHFRYADRTVADIAARDTIIPRDYARLPDEISARTERLEDLYRTGGIATRGAHVEELYPPGEIAARADRVGIATRADHLEDLYRSDRLVSRAVDPLPRSTYHTSAYETNPAYAETSTRPVSARFNGPSAPVSSIYSFPGAPVYRWWVALISFVESLIVAVRSQDVRRLTANCCLP